MEGGKRLAEIPETLLKRRKARRDAEAKEAAAAIRQRKRERAGRQIAFKRAESYVRKFRKQERSRIRLEREACKLSGVLVAEEPRLAFVMRIKGINQVHPKIRKILQLFRLRQINTGVFVKLNKATVTMLRLVEPYIAWGYPSMKTVRDLIYKRGAGKVEKRRVRLTDNAIIEKSLGDLDIICMEDLAHEIYNLGPNFKSAANFLWPFKLSTPAGGWPGKNSHFVEGGDFGNRQQHINDLLKKMI